MKRVFLIFPVLFISFGLKAQIYDPGSRAKRAAENRANNQIDRGIDKGLDAAEEGISNIFKKKNKDSKNAKTSTGKTNEVGEKGEIIDLLKGLDLISHI